METSESKTNQYLIPANVSARFEFFEGFGWYEFKMVTIACIIGFIVFFSLGLIKKTVYIDANNIVVDINEIESNITKKELTDKKVSIIPTIWRLFVILIPGAGTFFLVKKEPSTGRSLIQTWTSFKEFKKKQKLYLYKYNSGSEG